MGAEPEVGGAGRFGKGGPGVESDPVADRLAVVSRGEMDRRIRIEAATLVASSPVHFM